MISKKIRNSARGEDCSLRMIGVGLKAADTMTVYSCSSCHDVLDGRSKGDVDWRDVLRALAETQSKLISKGLLVVK